LFYRGGATDGKDDQKSIQSKKKIVHVYMPKWQLCSVVLHDLLILASAGADQSGIHQAKQDKEIYREISTS
jgi:hypothetical protein